MHIRLDPTAEKLINMLESAGYSAYAVGGAVRDYLLSRPVNDTDIATSAPPASLPRALPGVKLVETGIKHGTVTAVCGGKPYEITTYRVESGYRDSRHPDSVRFVDDITADLARRDFTVNAMAYSPTRGFVDPFGGYGDLQTRTIRAVGEASARFSEDALRILRALRFASQLGFEIEPETARAILSLSRKLKDISVERVYSELKKLFCGDSAAEVINAFAPVLEEIAPLSGDTRSFTRLPVRHDMRFACIYGARAGAVLRALHAENAAVEIAGLCAGSQPIPKETAAAKRFIVRMGRENAAIVAAYRRALYGEDDDLHIERLLVSGECLSLKELAVNGRDLAKLGISGEATGRALDALLESVITKKKKKKKKALCELAIKKLDNGGF